MTKSPTGAWSVKIPAGHRILGPTWAGHGGGNWPTTQPLTRSGDERPRAVRRQKRILITGGTGSLGKVLVKRLLGGEMGDPANGSSSFPGTRPSSTSCGSSTSSGAPPPTR